jgi:hypothetical protein
MIETIETFVENITKTLKKNGYPDKKVALPLERMYEVAHAKGLNFNKARDVLKEQGIDHEKTTEKVIFFPKTASRPKMDFATMAAQAQEMMRNMSPEQLKAIQDMVANMTDEQKLEMMKQAKDLGILDQEL